MNTRRSFFQDTALLAALAAMVEDQGYGQPKDDKLSNFWDAYFEEAERDPSQVSRTASDTDLMEPAKRVQLIHATADGLIYPDGIDEKQLLSEQDAVLTVTPGFFRPAPDDKKAIAKSKGCQIRLDCVQTRPIMNLIAPMAWAGLASWSLEKTAYSASKLSDLKGNPVIDPKTGKQQIAIKATPGPGAPELKQLDFTDPNDPNAPVHNQVILPGGSGKMALNVRGVSQNQKLQTVLSRSVSYSAIVAPFFGFAPLAIPALKAFTTLLGAVFNHESVIMNSMPLQILATQDASNAPHAPTSVKIVGGDYIAIPINQAGGLKDNMDKLRVVNGWLVHQDSDKTLPPEQRAQDPKVPEVTYMSLTLNVQALATAQAARAKGGN